VRNENFDHFRHCLGGRGRTGSVVCMVLMLYFKISSDDALEICQKMYATRETSGFKHSPENLTQMDQIHRISKILNNF
jgi:hypothetical protein